MNNNKRELFSSRWGFILASIGSAVGMGNIWLFPTRVSEYGGGTFILPYLICVAIIGYSGVIGEIGLGRSTRSGSIEAFGKAMEYSGRDKRIGNVLGLLPTISSLLLAIGYTVVTGWILKYTIGTFTGSTLAPTSPDEYGAAFGSMASAFGNSFWQVLVAILFFWILARGVAKGIERANEIMMPLFYLLFIGLAIYVFFQPGSHEGYRYIFRIDPKGFMDPLTWIFALGQAFFSLSIGGSGTLIYGSYFENNEDILNTAKYIVFFDTLAAITASLVIIPAMATAGQELDAAGPGLLFIYLPYLFKGMPGGNIVAIVFFVAVSFGAISSIINLYELPIATLQDYFHFSRKKAVAVIGVLGLGVSLLIQGIVGGWMDLVSVYINPLGALIAAIMFYWVFGDDYSRNALQEGREKTIGPWLKPLGKYGFVFLTVIVYVLNIALGGIG